MIRKLVFTDFAVLLAVINDGTQAYKGMIPVDRWKEPYMPSEELREEFESGIEFFGWEENGELLGVMGIQPFPDIALIRHACAYHVPETRDWEQTHRAFDAARANA